MFDIRNKEIILKYYIFRAIKQDVDEPTIKKQKVDPEDEALEKTIESQNKEYFKLRDKLQNETKKPEYIAILEANKQYVPEGYAETLDHVTDILYYGALKVCQICKNGTFIFNGNSAYLCTGQISEWAKCDNVVKEPSRQSVKVPKYIQEKYSFLSKKFKVKTRALKTVPSFAIPKAKVKKEGQDDVDA